ncbi:MAG: PPOX class F420-dependent oxidoreductase [Acidimicrobiia bacterium]
MEVDQARSFIRQHHRAVLSTFRKDGTPQLSPVTVDVDDGGSVVISTRETASKTRNLRRDPRVSACVMADEFFGPWIVVEGRAEVVALPEAMDGLVEYYRSLSGEHPDWDDYRAAMVRDRRVLVRIEIERAGPDHHG